MNNRNDKNVVHFEKRSANKVGLFFLLILAIAGLGYGGYYVYLHRSEIDWELKLPWQSDSSKEEKEKNKNGESSKNNDRDDLVLPSKLNETENVNGGSLRIYDVKLDDKGYTISVDYLFPNGDSDLTIEKVLINGFEVSSTLTINEKKDEGLVKDQKPTTGTLRILRTELVPLKITGLKEITFFYRFTQYGKESTLKRCKFSVSNNIDFKTELEGLINIYKNDQEIDINYYETITDQDNTYIYFHAKNNTYANNKQIRVKKLIINGEIYDYRDLNFSLYRGAANLFSIIIPKDQVKEIKSFTISFFVIATKEDTPNSIYITNDYTVELS